MDTMTFTYDNYNDTSIEFVLTDVDFLPRVLKDFAKFLRAAGFTYVGVEKIERDGKDAWVFHKDYSGNDTVSDSYDWDQWGPDEEEAERQHYENTKEVKEVNQKFSVGDIVTCTNDILCGFTEDALLGKVGIVRHVGDHNCILVEWLDWNDGHGRLTGMDGSEDRNKQNRWFVSGVDLKHVTL